MNENISRIIADLFSQPKPGEDWGVRMQRFRHEVKKITEREEAVFGQFLAVLESFRTVIPDEKQRYRAAVQAISATVKLNKDGLLNGIAGQLAELAEIQKSFEPVIPGQRNELTVWDARAKTLRGEISQLKDRITQLENEEKGIVTYIAARQQELDYVEKTMQHVFTAIGSDITGVRNKIVAYTAEGDPVQPVVQAASEEALQPAPDPVVPTGPAAATESAGGQPVQATPEAAKPETEARSEQKESPGQTAEFGGTSVPMDPNLQKACPMCGGVMNYQLIGDQWMCYSCAYEEAGNRTRESTPDTGISGQAAAGAGPEATSDIWPAVSRIPGHGRAAHQKSTPSASDPDRKKACPVCHMNMLWYPEDDAWRCLSCDYERKI